MAAPEESTPAAGSARPPLAAGTRLGVHEIRSVHGRGASALTYAAVDTESGRGVLIKEGFPRGLAVRGDDGLTVAPASSAQAADFAEAVAEIRREADVLAALGIAGPVAAIEANGTAYLVMDRHDGVPLTDILRHGGLGAEEAAGLLAAVLDAVEAVHDAGFLHRDVKPANIVVDAAGDAALIDFGASRPMAPPGGPLPVSDLTPGYAAPEQYGPEDAEGPWTDLYAVAAIAYQIVTGAPPPDATARLAGAPATPASEAGGGRFPGGFLRTIDAALELDPLDRPRSAAAFQEALLDSLDDDQDDLPPTVRIRRQAPAAPPAPAEPVASRTGRRGRTAAVAIAAALLAVAGLWGWPRYQDWSRQTWVVDAAGGGDAPTIGDAIARARPGATVRVRPGTYAESLRLGAPLTLAGAGDPSAVVVAPPEGPCLVTTAQAGTITGITFAGAPGGGLAMPCLDLAAGRVLVEGIAVTGGAGPGLRLRDGAEATVRGSRFAATGGPGILVEAGARGTITDNVVEETVRAGIIVRGGAAPVIAANTLRRTGQAGVLFSDGGGRLANNVIAGAGASGIEVRGGADPEITGNRIFGAAEAGVYVYDGGAGRFSDNAITGNAYSGVVVGAGGDPAMTDNRIADNAQHGVLALDGARGRFDGNTVSGNGGHGFALGLGAETAITGNATSGNADPQVQTGEAPTPAPAVE